MSVDWSSGATQVMVVSADPDFADKWLNEQYWKCFWHNKRQVQLMRNYGYTPMVSDREIAGESRHDELVELMDGYAV